MAAPDYLPPTLLPAEPADIPALARLHVAAGGVDIATRLIFPTDTVFEETIRTMLQGQINSPEWLIMKAVDSESGDIMAWAAWKLCHYTGIDAKVKQQAEEASKANDGDEPDQAEKAPDKAEFHPPPGLGVYLRTHSREALDSWMGERRFILLNTLMTEPRYQGRGVGAALVRWGNARADADNVPSFLQGSAFAYKLYLKCGWKIVEQFDVDLREWTPSGKRDDMGYGIYSYYYMVRLPEPQSSGGEER